MRSTKIRSGSHNTSEPITSMIIMIIKQLWILSTKLSPIQVRLYNSFIIQADLPQLFLQMKSTESNKSNESSSDRANWYNWVCPTNQEVIIKNIKNVEHTPRLPKTPKLSFFYGENHPKITEHFQENPRKVHRTPKNSWEIQDISGS